jgi:hypothetical protein
MTGYDEAYVPQPFSQRLRMKTSSTEPKLSSMDVRLEQWMICKEPDRDGYGNNSWDPNPKHLYRSEDDARRDAEKFCRRDEKPYLLLQVVDVVEPQTPPISWLMGE